ncbi:MAG: CxxC-x17-CxxC domain-containing protein [Candidatus Falkowbacteria bacterium]
MGKFQRDGGFDDRRGGRDSGPSRGGFSRGGSFGGDREVKSMHRATCSDCGRSCEVPFKPNGTKPVFCSECFGKQQDGGGFSRGDSRESGRGFDRPRFEDKKMFSATCEKCGDKCEVPFRPTPGKAVLCSMCFGKGGEVRGGGKSSCDCKENFNILNAKLDKIIKALSISDAPVAKAPKPAEEAIFDQVKELIEEVEAPKKVRKPKTEKKAAKAKAEPKAKKAVTKKK